MPNWKKVVVSGSDAALNSLYAPSITGSLQGTASFALTASFVEGLGGANFTQSFSNQTTWNVTHNLGTKYVIVQAYDSNDEQILPETIDLVDTSSLTISFPTSETGTAIVSVGGALQYISGGGGSVDTSSLVTTASFYAFTASYTTGSFTGSFIGDGSQLTGIVSSKWTGSNPISRESDVEITGSLNVTGSISITQNITASRAFISSSNGTANGSTLTVYGSGSAQPVLTIQGSQGELFSVTDSLSGSLFSVNDISGLPILEVFSDNRIIQGDYVAPMLTTTVKNTVSAVGAFTVYELPTASYDGAWFEYVAKSGSDARAGQITSLWSGTSVNFTETTTTDFGDTSGLSFTVIVSGSNLALTGSVTTADWTIKTIVRSI